MYCCYIWLAIDFDFSVFLRVFVQGFEGCQYWLDPLVGVWEIGCGSAAGRPIVLAFCVKVPKVFYYEVQVVFWWWIVPVLCWKAQKSEVRVGENRPSEVVSVERV